MFEIQGDIAAFHSDGSRPNHKSWSMNISDIAIIALEFDDIPDYGYTETIIFINKQRQVFKVDIDKIKDKSHFNSFWKAVNERLWIDVDYQREFNPYFVKVVYPNQLYGARLFQPWSLTSWSAITLHYLSHLLKAEKRMLNKEIEKFLSSMKIIACAGLVLMLWGCSKPKDKPTLKSILLEQLRYTHTKKDWYVPLNTAVEGLTVEQANWSDSTDNHSIGQIVSHLAFWNERVLIAFQGRKLPAFNENNQETFTSFDKNQWQQTVHRLDSIQTLWERSVEGATEAQLHEWSSSIANICTHNAYHTGQIVYIRKRNGWWQEAKGVK